MTAVAPEPGAAAARLLDALRGGPHGREPERRAAAEVERRWPGTGEQFRRAAEFHAAIARQAATGGARSVIFAAPGYRPSGWPGAALPHEAAAAGAPGARYLYASADAAITLVWHRMLAPSGPRPRAMACQASAGDPGQVAGMARAAGLEEPWSVQLQLCAHWWPGPSAARVIAGYAEALPPGSSLVLSWATAGGQPPGGEMGRAVERAAGAMPVGHSAEAVAGWVADAGMRLGWGPADVRAWPGREWADAALAAGAAARVAGVVALRP